ncbi:MAG TPA: trypsin-like peptidase domain-containing protein [Acidimicrobiales bacterium]|nr:trypsin-like peptidase domain-containing protein [Acidimicrobiales bacterium]
MGDHGLTGGDGMAMAGSVVCNGLNAATGRYLIPELPASVLSQLALGEHLDPDEQAHLRARFLDRDGVLDPEVVDNVDMGDLAQAGWGVTFAHDSPPSIRNALAPLLDHRRDQARGEWDLYREYTGPRGHRPDETASAFMARHGVAPGERANPAKMPYYLLLVGDPERIPYRFQYQLDVTRAVGRLHFDTVEEYARYAASVVASENGPPRARTATFFGTRNADDPPTRYSSELLVRPLAQRVSERMSDWEVRTVLADDATKSRLGAIVGGEERPTLLFTATHGVGFPHGHPRQLTHQGALLCQDWPGPIQWQKEIPQDLYLAGDDVADDADVAGMVAFLFACYGLGTPKHDDFTRAAMGAPEEIAPHSFVGRLPQRLLGHPNGGALAVVGHVERAWGYSFTWPGVTDLSDSFSDSVCRLLDRMPVGGAVEPFNERYATLATALEAEKEHAASGRVPDVGRLSMFWTARNDARNYAVFGDPAVRLPLGSGQSGTPVTTSSRRHVVGMVAEDAGPATVPKTALAVDDLLAALSAEDPAVSDAAANELASWLRRADPDAAGPVSLEALAALRSKRRFPAMVAVAEGALRVGIESPLLLKLYAQALIDQGLAGAALAVLASARPTAQSETVEIEGLMARAHKQHFVESPSGARADVHLQRAIAIYMTHYTAAPSTNLWHGINAVALLARAERDGRTAATAGADWRGLANRLLTTVGEIPAGRLTHWDAAVAAEASVALGDLGGAGSWLATYTAHREADAFALAATLRQLREVWQIDEHEVTQRALVDLLEACLLKAEGGALDVDASMRASELDRDADYLQGVFGDDEYVTIQWYRAGLEASRSVVRIVRPLQGTVGTGFVLPGDAVHPQWKGRSVVLTNFHVVNRHGVWPGRAPGDLRAVFEDDGVQIRIREVLWESPHCTPGTNPPPSFDTAVLLLESESLPAPSYEVSPGPPPNLAERVYVIGYPLGNELAFSLNDNTVVGVNSSLLHYRAPTRKGSSGSPVFDDGWRLLALHHAGGTELPRLDETGTTHAANEGLMLSAIRAHLLSTGL